MADEYILKSYDGGAETTTLTTPFTVGGTTLGVANGSTFPDGSAGPFVVVVDRGLATEEKFLIDTTTGVNGTTFNIQQVAYDGTSASAHSVGAVVEHCLDAYSIEQANRYVNLQTTRGDLVSRTTTTTGRLAAGTNNHVLMADSTQALGLKYAEVGTGSIADGAILTAKIGDSQVTAGKLASASVTAAKISTAAAGTTGQVLAANTSAASGLEWQTLTTGFTMPVGSVMQYAGSTAPTGWLLCNGAEYAKVGTYAALYAVVQDAYATSHNYTSGPSASNFRVPDFRSAFAAGLGTGTWSDARGEFGGSKDAVAVTHDHGVTQNGRSTSIIFAHATTGFSYAGNHVVGYGAETSSVQIPNDSYDFPAANHDHIVNAAGVSGTDKNLPPYVTINYIIKF